VTIIKRHLTVKQGDKIKQDGNGNVARMREMKSKTLNGENLKAVHDLDLSVCARGAKK
jgi:hypothetical protein